MNGIINSAHHWFAAREVLGGWPQTPGEPDRREDFLPDCYQSLQPLWLRLHQRAHSEDPQRFATLLFPSAAMISAHTLWLTLESPVSPQWPPDIASPFWQMKSMEIWWARPNISKRHLNAAQVGRWTWHLTVRHIFQHSGGRCPGTECWADNFSISTWRIMGLVQWIRPGSSTQQGWDTLDECRNHWVSSCMWTPLNYLHI